LLYNSEGKSLYSVWLYTISGACIIYPFSLEPWKKKQS